MHYYCLIRILPKYHVIIVLPFDAHDVLRLTGMFVDSVNNLLRLLRADAFNMVSMECDV